MKYEEFIPIEDIVTFQRVKKMQMALARISREVIAELLRPDVLRTPQIKQGKEFLKTTEGLFRLANRANSDNTTEEHAHDSLGAEYIDMSDDAALQAFFNRHERSGVVTVEDFKRRVRLKLQQFGQRQAGALTVTRREDA